MKKYYKVLQQYNKTLISATFWGKQTRYINNQSIKPIAGCGPLAVFDNLDSAREFSKTFGLGWSIVIYECEIKRSRGTSLFKPSAINKKYKIRRTLSQCPSGTVFASQVKITKRVK